MESDKPGFWEWRYEAGKMPWDFQGVPWALSEYLDRNPAQGRSVLIPGCGSGYEIRAFHEKGWDVSAIEFCEAAVKRARGHLQSLGDKIIQGDYFAHHFGGTTFDLIYERTFLCSMPTERWGHYSRRVTELLRPGGLLAGFFLYGKEEDPPPYRLGDRKLGDILGNRFRRVEKMPVKDSLPIFRGMERWEVWSLIPGELLSTRSVEKGSKPR